MSHGVQEQRRKQEPEPSGGNATLALGMLLVLLTPGLLSAMGLFALKPQFAHDTYGVGILTLVGCPIAGSIAAKMLKGRVSRSTALERFAWWLLFTSVSLALAFGGCAVLLAEAPSPQRAEAESWHSKSQ